MDENRPSLDTQNPSSPSPGDKPRPIAGVGRALAGMLLTPLGLAIGLAGGALAKHMCRVVGRAFVGEGMPTLRTLALLVAGFLTLAFGGLLFIAGAVLLGKRGMVRFGCLLVFGGLATCLVNLLVTHGEMRIVTLFSVLAAFLGIIIIAAAKGCTGTKSIFDD
jgi:hypothetical protein